MRYMTLWLYGGFIYYVIELIYRNYSHESMFVVGGIAFLIISAINNYLPWSMNIIAQCVIGGLCITLLELVAGLIINVWLKLDVWDYSDAPLNILGQITPLYTLYWTGLTLAGIFIDDFLRWKIYGEQKPVYELARKKINLPAGRRE
jgi:uncharacterized membrane protein